MSSIRKSFKALNSVPADQISITAYFKQFNDALEVSEDIWATAISRIKRVNVIVDTPSSGSSVRKPNMSASVLPNLKHVTILVDSAIPAPLARESHSTKDLVLRPIGDVGNKRKRESFVTFATLDEVPFARLVLDMTSDDDEEPVIRPIVSGSKPKANPGAAKVARVNQPKPKSTMPRARTSLAQAMTQASTRNK
ncbi:hypothetical protein FRC07_000984 [Ceratobasidium sp. 392]|nr:hypothetical protein FRC07_000984 [Ceratobasidium sp. 392]